VAAGGAAAGKFTAAQRDREGFVINDRFTKLGTQRLGGLREGGEYAGHAEC
jgi:hypothetical protein